MINKLKRRVVGGARWLRSRLTRNSGILLYHRIADTEGDRFNLCVTPGNFDEQMAALAETGGALHLGEFVERQKRGKLHEGSVAVTFDDGYLDNLRAALPILESHKIPATIFIVTGNFGEMFWWDQLAEIVYRAPDMPESIRLGGKSEPLDVRAAGRSRHRILDDLYPYYRTLIGTNRKKKLNSLAKKLGSPRPDEIPDRGRRSMTVEELREIAGHPLITIGAHTVSHAQLSSMSEDVQKKEIGESVAELESLLRSPVKMFSYPFGQRKRDYTEETQAAAEACGLECALAADLNVVTRSSHPFALPRLWVHDWDGKQFKKSVERWLPAGKHSPRYQKVKMELMEI